jgi:hypothetical protein
METDQLMTVMMTFDRKGTLKTIFLNAPDEEKQKILLVAVEGHLFEFQLGSRTRSMTEQISRTTSARVKSRSALLTYESSFCPGLPHPLFW